MFTEANTVEQMVLDAYLTFGHGYVVAFKRLRQTFDVFVDSIIPDPLIRLFPDIAAQPDRHFDWSGVR
jgi:hypothetical protein